MVLLFLFFLPVNGYTLRGSGGGYFPSPKTQLSNDQMTLNDYALAKREVLNSASVPRRESFPQSNLGVEPEGTQRKTCVSVRLVALYIHC